MDYIKIQGVSSSKDITKSKKKPATEWKKVSVTKGTKWGLAFRIKSSQVNANTGTSRKIGTRVQPVDHRREYPNGQ